MTGTAQAADARGANRRQVPAGMRQSTIERKVPWPLLCGLHKRSTAHLAGSWMGPQHDGICSCICITGSTRDTWRSYSHKASKRPCQTTCQWEYPTCGNALGTGIGLAGLLLSCLSSELGYNWEVCLVTVPLCFGNLLETLRKPEYITNTTTPHNPGQLEAERRCCLCFSKQQCSQRAREKQGRKESYNPISKIEFRRGWLLEERSLTSFEPDTMFLEPIMFLPLKLLLVERRFDQHHKSSLL